MQNDFIKMLESNNFVVHLVFWFFFQWLHLFNADRLNREIDLTLLHIIIIVIFIGLNTAFPELSLFSALCAGFKFNLGFYMAIFMIYHWEIHVKIKQKDFFYYLINCDDSVDSFCTFICSFFRVFFF